jgi:hypothetical protein
MNPTQTAPKVKVSPFAATEIGHSKSGDSSNFAFMKQHFREEAGQVTKYLRGVHHARKIGHMQVAYSETIEKMSKAQVEKPVVLAPQAPPAARVTSKQTSQDQMQYAQLMQTMNASVASEQSLNFKKRLHNREVGRRAILNDVMAGTAPIPKVELYPQGVTHTQMLAMTGTLAMPSAHTLPPEPKARKKWMGEGEGWGPTPR